MFGIREQRKVRRTTQSPKGLKKEKGRLRRSGDDLLSRVLRRSTISAERFHGRVRYGNVWYHFRYNHQTVKTGPVSEKNRYLLIVLVQLKHSVKASLLCTACEGSNDPNWLIELLKSMEQLVTLSCTPYGASTCVLST